MNATKRILVAAAILGAAVVVPASAAAAAAPVANPLIVIPPESRNQSQTTGWISPTALNFGSRQVGSSTAQEIRIKATGFASLFIDELSLSDPAQFRLLSSNCPGLRRLGIPAPESYTCPSGSSHYNPEYAGPQGLPSTCTCTITISFAPESAGTKIGALTIAYNSSDNSPAVINFTGKTTSPQTGGGSAVPQPVVHTGARPPLTTISITPSALDFGGEAAGFSRTKSFKIENTGSEPLYISSLSLSDSANFGIAKNECLMTPQSVPPRTSCTITADFAPQTPGKIERTEGTLTIAANTKSGSRTVALSGRTIPCDVSWGYAPNPPRVTPQKFSSGKDTVLTVNSGVGWSVGLIENSMTLLRVDSQGNQIAVLGELHPTGNEQYSGQFTVNQPSPGPVYFAVRVYYSGFPGCTQSTNNEVPIEAVEAQTATGESAAELPAPSSSSEPEKASSAAIGCSVNTGLSPYTPAPYTPTVNPQFFYAGNETSVTAKTYLPPDSDLIPGSAGLYLVDAHGKKLAKLASLNEDGANSHEFTGKFAFKPAKMGDYFVAARARYRAGPTCRQSYNSVLNVHRQLTAAENAQSESSSTARLSRNLAMMQAQFGRDKALASEIKLFRGWPGGTASVCPDGKTLCVKYKNGSKAVIRPDPDVLEQYSEIYRETAEMQKRLSNPRLAIVEQKVRHVTTRASMRLRVVAMKLLAPGIGWVVTDFGRKLYWTANNGEKWNDITPPGVHSEDLRLAQVFFLDTQTGWALLSSFKPELQTRCDSGQPRFVLVSDPIQLACGNGTSKPPPLKFILASTKDGGATWSSWPLKIEGANDAPLSPFARLSFADRSRGWLNFGFIGQSDPRTLLTTNDGGQSWQFAPKSPPTYDFPDDIELVTPEEGFALELSGHGLFVTRDGTRSWQEIKVTPPKEAGEPTYSSYSMPIFTDGRHGYLPTIYGDKFNGPGSSLTTAALYATRDGGRTWKVNRVMKNLGETTWGMPIPSAIADGVWILSADAGPDRSPKLTELKPGERIDAPISWGYLMPKQLSFVTPDRGWLLHFDGWLQSTDDGGSNWTNITPGMPPAPHHPIVKAACPLADASILSISGGYGYPGPDFGTVSAMEGSNSEITPGSIELVQVDGKGSEIADLGPIYRESTQNAGAPGCVTSFYDPRSGRSRAKTCGSGYYLDDLRSGSIPYKGKFRIEGPAVGQVTLAARATFKNPPTCRQSESYVLPINIPSTEAEDQAEGELKRNIAGFFAGQRDRLGDAAARKATIAFAKGQPDVLDAGLTNDGIGIWVKSKAGIDTIILGGPPGSDSGATQSPPI